MKAVVFSGLVDASTQPALTLTPNPNFQTGYGTTISVDDLNGDGLDDLMVGTPNASGEASCDAGGVAYLYQSSSSGPLADKLILQAPHELPGELFGWAVAVAPVPGIFLISERSRDVDGDGLIDGQVYVYKKD